MPRVIKHPDVRRAEMLDRALGLFLQRGYDNVSLNDLIAESGVSKGAFYHWFPSRDALITGLAERSANEQLIAVERALAMCGGNALDRLNAVLQAGFDVKMRMGTPEHLAAMVSLLGPENAHLYGRIVRAGEDLFRPLLTQVIADGVAEGIFDTFDPEGVGDMIQALAARTNSKILDVVRATDEPARDHAIDVLTTRFSGHRPHSRVTRREHQRTDPRPGRVDGRGPSAKLLMPHGCYVSAASFLTRLLGPDTISRSPRSTAVSGRA